MYLVVVSEQQRDNFGSQFPARYTTCFLQNTPKRKKEKNYRDIPGMLTDIQHPAFNR